MAMSKNVSLNFVILAALLVVLPECSKRPLVISTLPSPARPPAPTIPSPPPKPEPPVVHKQEAPRPRSLQTPGIAVGFKFCCGDDRYRLYMLCRGRMMRCYHNNGSRWRQTYGIKCKQHHRKCYFSLCSEVCDK